MEVLFRALIEDQNEFKTETNSIKNIDGLWYAIGNEITCHRGYYIKIEDSQEIECNYDSRAIWFDFMLDSNNNPIFASLDESGLGGDKIRFSNKIGGREDDEFVVIFDEEGGKEYYEHWDDCTVVGLKR